MVLNVSIYCRSGHNHRYIIFFYGHNHRSQVHSTYYSYSLRVLFITIIKLCWWWIMMKVVIESDYVMYLFARSMPSVFLLLRAYHFLTDNSLQSADKIKKKAVLWQRNGTMPSS